MKSLYMRMNICRCRLLTEWLADLLGKKHNHLILSEPIFLNILRLILKVRPIYLFNSFWKNLLDLRRKAISYLDSWAITNLGWLVVSIGRKHALPSQMLLCTNIKAMSQQMLDIFHIVYTILSQNIISK